MKVRLSVTTLAVAVSLIGILCGELICNCVPCRSWLGELFGRGKLLALAGGSGIYEADLLRAIQEERYLGANEEGEILEKTNESRLRLQELVANAMAEHRARDEKISSAAINHEYDILGAQLGTWKLWAQALHENGFSSTTFRRRVAKGARVERWIERQLTGQTTTGVDECRQYFEAHAESYSTPLRLHASHLFLAAPPETTPAIVERKRRVIEQLFTRLAHGENFRDLAARMSEDEATKAQGGDLGFFSQTRMPADFFAAVATMRVGEISGVIRTRLGFHIVQLTKSDPPRQMTFDESQTEVALFLGNKKRQARVKALMVDLAKQAEFMRSSL
jgi:parvulin-like peptidyl-prolyl isomerase